MRNAYPNMELVACIPAQSITNTTVNGAALVEPWRKAAVLGVIIIGGALAATVDGAIKLQGRKRSDASWVNLTGLDGSTLLEVTPTKLDDGGALENGVIWGEVQLDRIPSATYDAVRVTFQEAGNAAALVGIAYQLWNFYRLPSGQTAEFHAIASGTN